MLTIIEKYSNKLEELSELRIELNREHSKIVGQINKLEDYLSDIINISTDTEIKKVNKELKVLKTKRLKVNRLLTNTTGI